MDIYNMFKFIMVVMIPIRGLTCQEKLVYSHILSIIRLKMKDVGWRENLA